MYLNFIKRNIQIYLKDKTGIFFSLLGMLISLIIYVFFLRSNLISSLSGIGHVNKLVDIWMIAGLISIVSMTTPLNAFGQKLEDKKNNRLNDFVVNNNFSLASLDTLYVITAIIEGVFSTIIFMFICFGYLYMQYKESLFNSNVLVVIFYSILLIIFSSLLFSLITSWLTSTSSFSSLSAIVGTLAGFFSGTYIVYGDLPNFMQQVLDVWPGFQIAATIRNKMLGLTGVNVPKNVLDSLGVVSNSETAILITLIAMAICVVFSFLIIMMSKKK